jgi:hypothetical protein
MERSRGIPSAGVVKPRCGRNECIGLWLLKNSFSAQTASNPVYEEVLHGLVTVNSDAIEKQTRSAAKTMWKSLTNESE